MSRVGTLDYMPPEVKLAPPRLAAPGLPAPITAAAESTPRPATPWHLRRRS